MRRLLAALDSRTGRAAILVIIVAAAGLAALCLHRDGHMLGDDFALYLRQARSIFEGNTAEVVADNRFIVDNSPDGISPIAYPWGWPLLLSPFVQFWGLDFGMLKLLEVALLLAALVLLHGVLRRRTNRWIATAVVLVFASAPVYLAHTDQLLSEYPHLVATLILIWWIDRLQRTAAEPRLAWLSARTGDLVATGLLAALAFNIRRESVVLFAVIAASQAVEVLGRYRRERRMPLDVRSDLRRLAIPHVAYIGGIVGFQLLLPTTLVPDNGGGVGHIPSRVGDSFAVFTQQLGLYTGDVTDITGAGVAWIGVVLVVMALIGAAVACWRDPRRNVPLVVLMLTTMATIGTHFRLVDRYYLQVTPWVLFFATYTLFVLTAMLVRLVRRWSSSAWLVRVMAGVVGAVLVVIAAAVGGLDGSDDELADGYATPWAAVVIVACAVAAVMIVAAATAATADQRVVPPGAGRNDTDTDTDNADGGDARDEAELSGSGATEAAGRDATGERDRSHLGRRATAVAVLPLLALTAWHVTDLPGRVDSARTFSEDTSDVPRCSRQWLPDADPPAPVFSAVELHTPPDSVVAFYRARLMTLYTDRASIQPGRLETVARRADYFAMLRNCEYSQPSLTDDEADDAGLTKVWEDEQWVLWRFPEAVGS